MGKLIQIALFLLVTQCFTTNAIKSQDSESLTTPKNSFKVIKDIDEVYQLAEDLEKIETSTVKQKQILIDTYHENTVYPIHITLGQTDNSNKSDPNGISIENDETKLVSKAKLKTFTKYRSIHFLNPKMIILSLVIISGIIFITYTFCRKNEDN